MCFAAMKRVVEECLQGMEWAGTLPYSQHHGQGAGEG